MHRRTEWLPTDLASDSTKPVASDEPTSLAVRPRASATLRKEAKCPGARAHYIEWAGSSSSSISLFPVKRCDVAIPWLWLAAILPVRISVKVGKICRLSSLYRSEREESA